MSVAVEIIVVIAVSVFFGIIITVVVVYFIPEHEKALEKLRVIKVTAKNLTITYKDEKLVGLQVQFDIKNKINQTLEVELFKYEICVMSVMGNMPLSCFGESAFRYGPIIIKPHETKSVKDDTEIMLSDNNAVSAVSRHLEGSLKYLHVQGTVLLKEPLEPLPSLEPQKYHTVYLDEVLN